MAQSLPTGSRLIWPEVGSGASSACASVHSRRGPFRSPRPPNSWTYPVGDLDHRWVPIAQKGLVKETGHAQAEEWGTKISFLRHRMDEFTKEKALVAETREHSVDIRGVTATFG